MIDTNLSTDKAHAVFSASGSERWLNCAGSIALSKDMPKAPDTPQALEGTDAHACLEYLLKNHRKLDAALKGAMKKWSEEMISHALSAVRIILEILSKAGPGAILECETKVDSSSFTMEGQFGTVDAAVVDEFGRLTVIDYKYGTYPVDPAGQDGKGNSQLVYYALGISAKYDHNFEDVELIVIQPRSFEAEESGQIAKSFVMSMDELLAWGDRFYSAVGKCQSAEVHALRGEIETFLNSGKWCKFCPAAPICPELRNKAMRDAQIVFSDTQGIESVPEPKLLSGVDLRRTLDACDQLELWITRVREHAFQVLQRGGQIEGYKLVDKRPQRKWADEKKAETIVWDLFGEDGFTESKLLSPAQVEKLKHWLHDQNEIKDVVRKLTVKESSGRTIAKDSDNRLAVNPLDTVFTVIDVSHDQTEKRKINDKQK